jgi:hypothetical protein
MAMDFDALGTKIAQDILIQCGQLPAGPAFAKMKEIWTIAARDIVQHIQENAEVPEGISVSTSGSPTTQKGATDGKGKVV